jgi:hypothetical protein
MTYMLTLWKYIRNKIGYMKNHVHVKAKQVKANNEQQPRHKTSYLLDTLRSSWNLASRLHHDQTDQEIGTMIRLFSFLLPNI